MSTVAKVTRDGNITVPEDVLHYLELQVGDEVEFIRDENGVRLRKRTSDSAIGEYRGYLKHLTGKNPDDLVEEIRGR